jgi:hypothetical protein
MMTRLTKLALVGALCVLASASAHAAGEFEAGWRKAYLASYRMWLNDVAGEEPNLSSQMLGEEIVDCYTAYVMQEFSPDEIVRLNAWAAGGPYPGKDIEARLIKRSTGGILPDEDKSKRQAQARRAVVTVANDVCRK